MSIDPAFPLDNATPPSTAAAGGACAVCYAPVADGGQTCSPACASVLRKLNPAPATEHHGLGSPGSKWPFGSLRSVTRPVSSDGAPRKIRRRLRSWRR